MENIQKRYRLSFGKDILKRNRAGKEDAIYLKKEDSYEDHNLWIKHSDQQTPAYPS